MAGLAGEAAATSVEAEAAVLSDDMPRLIATASAAWAASPDDPTLGFVCIALITEMFSRF